MQNSLRSFGLLIDAPILDGQIHRCPTITHPQSKNGWYIGEFFNNGIRQVDFSKDDSFDKNFDYIYELDKVSPCSF